MTTITETQDVYVHLRQYSEGYDFFMCDMSEHGHVLVAKQEMELTFDLPEDFNPTAAKIDSLKAEQQKIADEAQAKRNNIEEQIQNLLCLEDKSGE